MEELEKNQKVGEIITQADQTISSSSSPPRRIRSAASATRLAEDVDNGITKVTTQCEEAVSKIILKSIPSDSQITFVRFEGPNIALYTKNPRFSLTELTYYLSSLSKTLKKRFIVRTDNSIRLQEDETRSIVAKILPKDVVVSAVFCDDATGEVVLEVNKPEAIDSETIINIAQSTGWIAHLRRSSHISSMSIKNIHTILKSSSKERSCFLRELGKRVFREPLIKRMDE